MINFFWKIINKLVPVFDFLLSPLTLIASFWFFLIRKSGIHLAPVSKSIFLKIGIFPIRDHYYEPLFNATYLSKNIGDRNLPGINLNIEEQLLILKHFKYRDELRNISLKPTKELKFYYHNPSFFAGDAEYLYNMIRFYKPNHIIEIGSGFSTLMAIEAVKANKLENIHYNCKIQCIEPYEMSWLEKTGVTVIRKKVQDLDVDFFKALQPNDILFIDSSHIIRPQGDVLFEYLEVLPVLNSGVLVHIHDIFTPRDYLFENFEKYIVFINEQYLVEAFLTMNNSYKIIGALNYLKHNHFDKLAEGCPVLQNEKHQEPRSLWIVKN